MNNKLKMRVIPMENNVLAIQFLYICDSFLKKTNASFSTRGLDGRIWRLRNDPKPSLYIFKNEVEISVGLPMIGSRDGTVPSWKFDTDGDRKEFVVCIMQVARDFSNNWDKGREGDDEMRIENWKTLIIDV